MNRVQRFFYRFSPRFLREFFWGMDDNRLMLPEDNMFRYFRGKD